MGHHFTLLRLCLCCDVNVFLHVRFIFGLQLFVLELRPSIGRNVVNMDEGNQKSSSKKSTPADTAKSADATSQKQEHSKLKSKFINEKADNKIKTNKKDSSQRLEKIDE